MSGLTLLSKLPMPSPRAAIAAILVFTSFAAGWTAQGWRKDQEIGAIQIKQMEEAAAASRAIAERARVVAEREDARRSRERIAAELAAEREKEAVVVDRIVETEVIKYVKTPNAAASCISPSGVLVHDTATGTIPSNGLPTTPAAAAAFDAAARKTTNADFVALVAANYRTCRAIARRLFDLQEWLREGQ